MADYYPTTDPLTTLLSDFSNFNVMGVDPTATGDDQLVVVSGASLRSLIRSGLQASSPRLQELIDLFAAAPNGAVVRKRADGAGYEIGLPKLLQFGTVTGTTVSGTVASTQMATLTIPANTLQIGDRLFIEFTVDLPNPSTTTRSLIVRLNGTSGTGIAGAASVSATNISSVCFSRVLQVTNSTTLRGLVSTAVAGSPYGGVSGLSATIPIDRAVDNTLHLMATMGATTESAELVGFFAQISRN